MCDIWAGADAPKYWCTYYPNYNMCDITEKPDIGQIWPKNYALQLICPKLKGKSWHQAGFDQLMLSRVGYLFPNPISTGLNLNFNERHLIFRFRMSGGPGWIYQQFSLRPKKNQKIYAFFIFCGDFEAVIRGYYRG